MLRAHEPELRASGVVSLSVFGSVARGEERRDSDLDVMVRLTEDASRDGFAYFGRIEALTIVSRTLSAGLSMSSSSPSARTGCAASSRKKARVPSEKPLGRLEDILDNIVRIERFTAGLDFTAFAANEQAFYATLHALLIVSEAARKLRYRQTRSCPANRGRTSAALATSCAMNTTALILKPFGGLSAAVI